VVRGSNALIVTMIGVLGLVACGGKSKPKAPSTTGGSTASRVAASPTTGATSAAPSVSTAATPSASATPTSLIPPGVPTVASNPTTPGEKAPVPPKMWDDQQGAQDFAVFFAKTIDWADATVDTTYMSLYFEPTCDLCSKLKQTVDLARKANESYDGGRATVVDGVVIPKPPGDKGQYVVKVYMSTTAAVIKSPSGVVVNHVPGLPNFNIEFSVAWRGTAWTVVDARLYRP